MKRLALAFAVLPLSAHAHPGDHSSNGFLHLLTEPDHLALLATIVVAAVLWFLRLRARR